MSSPEAPSPDSPPFQLPFPPGNATYTPAAFGQAEWVEWDTLAVTLAGNLTVAVACLLYFGFFRAADRGYFSAKRRKLPHKTPPDLPPGLLSWIPALIGVSDEDVLKHAGFDATVLLRFYRMAFKICLWFSLYGLAVIVPANVRGGLAFTTQSKTTINTFNELSMSNIQHYDSKMWLHAVGLYLLTFLTLYYLILEFSMYKTLRHEFMRRRNPHHRSVLLEGVPRHMRSSNKLVDYFNILYDGTVSSVRVPQDLTYLSSLLRVRQHVLTKLERCLVFERSTGRTPTMRSGCLRLGPQIASIPLYTAQLRRINRAVAREQTRRLAPAARMVPSRQDLNGHVGGFDLAAEIRALGLQLDRNGAGPIERSVHCRWDMGRDIGRRTNGSGFADSLGKPRSGSDAYWSGNSQNALGRGRRSLSFDEKESTPLLNAIQSWMNGDDGGSVESVRSDSRAGKYGGAGGAEPESDSEWDVGGSPKTPTSSKRGGGIDIDGGREGAEAPFDDTEDTEALVLLTGDKKSLLPEEVPINEQLRASRAFVTFTSYTAAATAMQVLHCSKPGRIDVRPAPEPRDVYWPNIIVSRRAHLSRWILVEAVLISSAVFYPLIVTLLSYMLSPDQLTAHYAVINDLCSQSKLFRSTVDLIQPLLLISLMAILPAILFWVGCLEGLLSYSENQMLVLSRFYAFQVINVFLVTTIAGSMFDVVSKIANHPSDTFTLLGETLPKMAGFFCNYVLIRALSGLSLELIRAFSFAPAWIRFLHRRDKTPRDRRKVLCGMRAYHDPGPFNYGKVFAQDLLVLTLCLTYACIAPIILLAGLTFFGLAWLVYKHQLLFAYEPQFESGGAFFPKVFRRIIFALFTAQATMVGMFLLKRGTHQVYAISILMIITYIYKLKMREVYEPVSSTLPREIAKALDVVAASNADAESELNHDEFLQPELKAIPYAAPVLDEGEEDLDVLALGV